VITNDQPVVVDLQGIDELIGVLRRGGYLVLGPVVRDGAICIGELHSRNDLPQGWKDIQAPGYYRLEHTDSPAIFEWAVGQQSIRGDVFPSRSVVWRAEVDEGTVRMEETTEDRRPTAFFGVRPCEVAALRISDTVYGIKADPVYLRRRPRLVVTSECASPAATCFCTSMGTGPKAVEGYDVALTELIDEGGHRFVMRPGSEQGAELLGKLQTRPAAAADLSATLMTASSAAPAGTSPLWPKPLCLADQPTTISTSSPCTRGSSSCVPAWTVPQWWSSTAVASGRERCSQWKAIW
jgi:sulfhydrogenase subunit beta (sulfur reductase)